MREYLNENTLYTTLAMLIAERSGTMLVVEGKYDELALKKHALGGLQIVSGTGGREHITGAARIAHERGLSRIKFLVDRDYDPHLPSVQERPDNVMSSSTHDLFIDLLRSEPVRLLTAIETALFGAEDAGLEGKAKALLEKALRRSAQLASLRIVSARESLNISFESARFTGVLHDKKDIVDIAEILLLKGRRSDVDAFDYSAKAVEVFNSFNGEYWSVVGDHDFLDALTAEMRARGANMGKYELQRTVVAMISCKAVRASAWFEGLQNWCRECGVDGFECDSDQVLVA